MNGDCSFLPRPCKSSPSSCNSPDPGEAAQERCDGPRRDLVGPALEVDAAVLALAVLAVSLAVPLQLRGRSLQLRLGLRQSRLCLGYEGVKPVTLCLQPRELPRISRGVPGRSRIGRRVSGPDRVRLRLRVHTILVLLEELVEVRLGLGQLLLALLDVRDLLVHEFLRTVDDFLGFLNVLMSLCRLLRRQLLLLVGEGGGRGS